MNKDKRQALEAAGFVIGDAGDFLGLTDDERQLVELRVAVSRAVRARREQQSLTQTQVAKKLKTSQPRVAKIEAGASDVSLDLMFRGFFVLGGNLKDLRAIFCPSKAGSQLDRGSRSARQAHADRRRVVPNLG
jgi:predicted XRE-type DNA-binding protein